MAKGLARLKPVTRSCISVSRMGPGTKVLRPWVGTWMWNGTPLFLTSAQMGCWHCWQWFHSLCHNAGPECAARAGLVRTPYHPSTLVACSFIFPSLVHAHSVLSIQEPLMSFRQHALCPACGSSPPPLVHGQGGCSSQGEVVVLMWILSSLTNLPNSDSNSKSQRLTGYKKTNRNEKLNFVSPQELGLCLQPRIPLPVLL